jgi:excisionase family DNA binding protein
MNDRWMSVGEMAAHLGVSKDTIYTWASTRKMLGHKVGRFWKFKADEVDGWVRAEGAAVVARVAQETG